MNGEEEIEDVQMPENIDPTKMKGNLEDSKQPSWFNLLFGFPKKQPNVSDSSDIKLLKEQRKKALEAQEKKAKLGNMINMLSKFRLDSLRDVEP